MPDGNDKALRIIEFFLRRVRESTFPFEEWEEPDLEPDNEKESNTCKNRVSWQSGCKGIADKKDVQAEEHNGDRYGNPVQQTPGLKGQAKSVSPLAAGKNEPDAEQQ